MKLTVDYTDDIVRTHKTIKNPFLREVTKMGIKFAEISRNFFPWLLILIVIDVLLVLFFKG